MTAPFLRRQAARVVAWAGFGAAFIATTSAAAPPTAHVVSYESPSVGRTLKCRVLLPAGYESSGRRYPVLYLLHGFSGDYTNWTRHGVERAAAPYDLIVVQVDGGNSWYVNWAESDGGEKNAWEDALVKDLIGHVDAHFRTVAAREGRAINGLSMGGYGALTVGLRHPDLFCSVGSHSGALDLARSIARTLRDDPNARLPERKPTEKVNPSIGLDDFDGQDERTPHGRIFATPEQCAAHDPFSLVAKVPPDALPHLYVDCGTEDPFIDYNQEFARLLMERKVPFTFAQSRGGHRSAYWTRAVVQSLAVQYDVLTRALAAKAP